MVAQRQLAGAAARGTPPRKAAAAPSAGRARRLRPLGARAAALALAALATAAAGAWDVMTNTDPMDDSLSVFAFGDSVGPVWGMSFPYDDVDGHVGYACSPDFERAYVSFSATPNLVGGRPVTERMSALSTRVRFDDDPHHDTVLFHVRGSKTLFFGDTEWILPRIRDKGSMLLELDWYPEGLVLFRFPLRGSAGAIAEAREQCGRPGSPASSPPAPDIADCVEQATAELGIDTGAIIDLCREAAR